MTATELLVRQHRRITQLAASLEHERHLRRALVLDLVEELSVHLTAEERVLHPAAESHIDASLREHRAQVATVRARLAQVASGDDSREAVRALAEAFATHATLDARLLEALEHTLDAAESAKLAARFERTCASLLGAWRASAERPREETEMS